MAPPIRGDPVLHPLKGAAPRFSEEQLEEIESWYNENAKPILVIDEGEPITAITVPQYQSFLALKKFHRRNFHYPNYGEIMNEMEKLHTKFLMTYDIFLYMLDIFVQTPKIRHELELAFEVFDTEKRDYLDLSEITAIVTTYDEAFNDDELREFLRDVNVKGDGLIYYRNFVKIMFDMAPELYDVEAEYLFEDPDEDPSVPAEIITEIPEAEKIEEVEEPKVEAPEEVPDSAVGDGVVNENEQDLNKTTTGEDGVTEIMPEAANAETDNKAENVNADTENVQENAPAVT